MVADPQDLEAILREAIIDGQPLHHRPWTKILVMMEGIYSMEGEVGKLKEIVAVAKKYKVCLQCHRVLLYMIRHSYVWYDNM